MTGTRRLVPLGIAAACLWPALAAAQQAGIVDGGETLSPEYNDYVEIGSSWVGTDSFKFGEYSGLEGDGPFAVGNVEFRRRSAWDSRDTDYWQVVGTNLGLESRSVHLEYGRQGRFNLFADYDQIPHFRLDDAVTPFEGAGGADLTLPANWAGATTTSGMTALGSNLESVDIETERERFGGGFTWHPAKEWELKGTYAHEVKDGLETVAGVFGTSGGNPRAAILPQPVDQSADELDVSLGYAGKQLQAELAYRLSVFANEVNSLTWSNPFLNPGGWNAAADFAAGGRGRLALAPDNQAQQVALSAGFTPDPTTRVSGQFSYGRMTQDDDFLPFTLNPTLAASITTPLPRESLDGRIDTLHGNLTLSARPLEKLDFTTRYTLDDRDNDTPRDVYVVVRNDTETQRAVTSDRARVNRPYGRTRHKVEVDAGYPVLPSTKLQAGYDFERIHRDFQEVDDTGEHTARVKLRAAPVGFATGWVAYARSFRTGSTYASNQPFLDGHADSHLSTLAQEQRFENDPLIRKYYLADRVRDALSGSVTFLPHDAVTLGLSGSHTHDDFYATDLGLTDRKSTSLTADASVTPEEDLTVSAFLTYDRGRHDQTGFQRVGGALPPGAGRDSQSFWNVVTNDRAYTAGTGVEWAALEDTLDLALDYTFSRAITGFDIDGGTSLAFAELPQLTTTLNTLGLRGEYRLREDLAVGAGYRFEWFRTRDFAQDGVAPDTISQVISLGDSSPDYVAHVVGVSLISSF